MGFVLLERKFLCSVLYIIVCHFSFAIVLSALLQSTASGYPFATSNFS